LAYGPRVLLCYRHVVSLVDKVLRGAQPHDLPIEQPTKFELVVNLKTANSIGMTVSPMLLYGDRLRGWGERTRTRKCRFTTRWAELLGSPEHFRTRDFSRELRKRVIVGWEPGLAQATVEDRWTPTIKLDEEHAIAVRELDATAYLALQHNQLLPERSTLCFKSAFRLAPKPGTITAVHCAA
jgi:hypothetical protein